VKVLLVSAMFPPIRTGTSFYAKNLASSLVARGHSVSVVALENDEGDHEHYPFRLRRLPAFHLRFLKFFKHFRICSIYLGNFHRMRKVAKECEADVVLLVNHYLDIAFPAIYAAKALGLPLICSVGTQLQSSNPWRHKLLNVFDRLICGNLVFPHCTKVIAWDREILRYLVEVHGPAIEKKCEIVNYGVNGDPTQLLNHQHDYALHNQILCIGSVIKQRSYVPLVRAFALIADAFPQLQIKIIGHIYFEEAVHTARQLGVADRVVFTGELPHTIVLEELSRSDAYYVSLTGRYLGLGTATIEAMLMGVPSIANIPGDLLGTVRIEDGTHLVIANDASPESIAGKLRSVLLDPQLRHRVGQGGRCLIQEQMSWDKVARDLEMSIMPLIH
jgi:glycosyltransferase involved in cell wall biosynthesis